MTFFLDGYEFLVYFIHSYIMFHKFHMCIILKALVSAVADNILSFRENRYDISN